MKDLDELKNIWKAQSPDAPAIRTYENRNSLMDNLEKQRKKIFRGNVIATSAMTITISFLTWMMFAYKDEHPVFYISISAIITVAVAVLFLLWRRNLKSVNKLSLDSKSYIDYQIRKLELTGKIIQYSPIYGLVLGILINSYAYSLIGTASKEFVFWWTNINWVYIILISFISYSIKMRRYKKNVEPLVRELQTLSEALS